MQRANGEAGGDTLVSPIRNVGQQKFTRHRVLFHTPKGNPRPAAPLTITDGASPAGPCRVWTFSAGERAESQKSSSSQATQGAHGTQARSPFRTADSRKAPRGPCAAHTSPPLAAANGWCC